VNRFNTTLRTDPRFIAAWQTGTFEGRLPFRELLNTTKYPGWCPARLSARHRRAGRPVVPLMHEAHMAARAPEPGVREIWTLEGDVARFPGLWTRNPLAAS